MSKRTKVTRGMAIDRNLLEVADELIVNKSSCAQDGLLIAVMEALDRLHPDVASVYREKLKHLIDGMVS